MNALRCLSAWVVVATLMAPQGLMAADAPAALVETPSLTALVAAGKVPAVGLRLPSRPLLVDFAGSDAVAGRSGGSIDLLMSSVRELRQMVVYGYARLVVYDRRFELQPDILRAVDVDQGRIFTLHLRPGHKWSDGHPFTAEDFRYWWEDMVTNSDFRATAPPQEMLVEGQLPKFEVIDELTVRYTWADPNHMFLPSLAGPTPLDIYRPAHYLKQFHGKYVDAAQLNALVQKEKQRNWTALHFRKDRGRDADNPSMPTLQPWINTVEPPSERFVFQRNPYYHRVDAAGRQLPYIDQVNVIIANAKLIPAKTGASESDLQARNLTFGNYTFLKQGEKRGDFKVHLWRQAKGSQIALFPNLNAEDAEWRKLFCEADFRRALSLATDRHEINQVIYFGLAVEANNTVLPESPLYRQEYATQWTEFDLAHANALLDGLGLTKRNEKGLRLLPDGRPMELIVELADVPSEATDVLELVHDSWLKVGIKIFPKPLQRDVFRNRVFAGQTLMSVWSGLENGVPTMDLSPRELAPTDQNHLQWPKWGQYVQTGGKSGEAVDMPVPKRLADLERDWRFATAADDKQRIWHEMLSLFADNVFTIGLVTGVFQPIVVDRHLRNVPAEAVFNWDPGAHFGIYRPDQFWLDNVGG